MQTVFVAAIATVLALGAGAGAMTQIGPSDAPSASLSDVANPIIDGQAMLREDNVFANIARSPEHTDLVAALTRAGLAARLAGKGPFTVFAPTNAAFAALAPAGQRSTSAGYFIVPGRFDSRALLERIDQNGGDATLKTLDGSTITASLNGPTNILLTDGQGNLADISVYDVYSSNGVIHVIDRAIEPRVPQRPTVAMVAQSPAPSE
ncbi:MAG: fasciclin domain-containing protein [Rhizomicrobium sp.]|jgi:uncharacterized surface protein with fasciclin (FAS1) repeats